MNLTLRLRRGKSGAIKGSLLIASLLCASLHTKGQVVITLPTIILSANAPVTVPLVIHNPGAAFQLVGFELDIQVGDGGPEAGGSNLGPAITQVDIFSAGLLFESNNNGASGMGSIVPQLYSTGTLTQPATTVYVPSGDTTLARITLDATGRASAPSSWNWTLKTLNGTTTLINSAGNAVDINTPDGSVSIASATPVPEPREWAIATGLVAGLACGLRRWLRA